MAKQYRERTLDAYWLEVLMCLIGEAFGEQGLIVNGAVVNIRLVDYLGYRLINFISYLETIRMPKK